VLSPSRLAVTTVVPVCAIGYLILPNPWAALIGCALLAVTATVLALLLLPAVWSRKSYRRDAAYDLIKLIIVSLKTWRK
jgi:membrane protein YdbS with pleckstrin-like domain